MNIHEFGAFFMKLVDKKALIASIDGWRKKAALGQSRFDVVTLAQGPTGKVRRRAKTSPNQLNVRNPTHKAAIRGQLNHP
jgi:hypothetical protein